MKKLWSAHVIQVSEKLSKHLGSVLPKCFESFALNWTTWADHNLVKVKNNQLHCLKTAASSFCTSTNPLEIFWSQVLEHLSETCP